MSISAESINSSTSTAIESSWFAVERISQEMQEAAAQKSWHHVVECAAARHRTLLQHFNDFPVGPENALFYRERLTHLLDGEHSLHALAVDARREIMRESAITNRNHKAVSTYLSII